MAGCARVASRVADHEWLAAAHGLGAVAMGERRFARGAPRLGDTDRALEELPVLIDEHHERNRYPERARREPGEAIEAFLGWCIDQLRVADRC